MSTARERVDAERNRRRALKKAPTEGTAPRPSILHTLWHLPQAVREAREIFFTPHPVVEREVQVEEDVSVFLPPKGIDLGTEDGQRAWKNYLAAKARRVFGDRKLPQHVTSDHFRKLRKRARKELKQRSKSSPPKIEPIHTRLARTDRAAAIRRRELNEDVDTDMALLKLVHGWEPADKPDQPSTASDTDETIFY